MLSKKPIQIINEIPSRPVQSEPIFKAPTDYTKLKLNALAQRSKNATNLNSLELKPATVEGNKSVKKLNSSHVKF